ncbi:MAG: hypothetical protein RLZZ241_2241 [Bacteroidota bacterium]
MKLRISLLVLFWAQQAATAQINPKNIEIVRDNYGVPHIYAPTDAEVAYGLAWAHAEDDFNTIQLSYLAGDAKLSKLLGLKGAPADFLQQLIQARKIAEEQYSTLDPKFIAVLEGYAGGLNAFAESHPKEVLVKQLFPVTPISMVAYSQLQLFVSNAADQLVSQIVSNTIAEPAPVSEPVTGSNLIALSSKKTGAPVTYLTINTHQPLEGPTSWYEAHLVSQEGTNIIGALFPGAPCILTGANENLGWTHTVNYQDKADAFKLEMVNAKRRTYKVDNDILTLEKNKARVFLKVLGLKIPVKRKFYTSIYGPTLKNKSGYYAVRTPSTTTIKALEQWWKMNKAASFSEFYKTLKMNAIPGYNIGYADKNDTIFYISNGKIPVRTPGYDWKSTVPGNTYATLWDTYYPTEALPQVISPASGFVYNANHSPFKSSGAADNPNPESFDSNMGYELYDNNRSTRLLELLQEHDTLNFEAFKTIKYDHTLPTPLNYNYVDFNAVFDMNPTDFPEVTDLLQILREWDRKADIDSHGAGIFAALYYTLRNAWPYLGPNKTFTREQLLTALKVVKRDLTAQFGTTQITLGMFQNLIRGNKKLPIWGLPDVITAMHGQAQETGPYRITNGESYIALIQFSANHTKYESVISYGNSNRPDSPHYNDQMELYQNFKTKPMSFDREEVLKTAILKYHPGE